MLDCTFFPAASQLTDLRIGAGGRIELTNLAALNALEKLDAPASQIESLHGVGGMTGLRSITLFGCDALTDIGELARLTAEALDIVEKLPPETELEIAGSSVDADLRNAPLQILTEHVPDAWPDAIAMLDDDIDVGQDDFFVRSVVGATAEDDEFAYGWIVGDVEAYESRPL